jgi:hypothetical protein
VNTTRKGTDHSVPREEINSGTKEHKPVIKIPNVISYVEIHAFIYLGVSVPAQSFIYIIRKAFVVAAAHHRPLAWQYIFSYPKEVTTVRCRIPDMAQSSNITKTNCCVAWSGSQISFFNIFSLLLWKSAFARSITT